MLVAIKRTLFLIILVVLVLWPMPTKVRHWTPDDYKLKLGLGNLLPVNISTNTEFDIDLGVPIEVFKRPIYYDDLKALKISDWHEKLTYDEFSRPYLFPRRIGLNVATYGRINQCAISLVLDHSLESNKIDCSTIKDNTLVFFDFERPLTPGSHRVTFNWTAEKPGNEIAIYAYKERQGGFYLDAFSQAKTTNFAKIVGTWVIYQPQIALSYLLLVILLVGLIYFDTQLIWRFLGLVAVLYLGVSLISRPFSGHDETAHIKMLQEAVDKSPETDIELNISAHGLMIDSDFYRLNEVQWVPKEVCPHMILYKCGASEKPMFLYTYYAPLLKLFGIRPGNADSLMTAGRVINTLTLGVFIVVQFILFGPSILLILSGLLIFYGGYLDQFSTISNDPPMFLLGIQAGILLFYSLRFGLNWRALLAYIVFCLCARFGLNVDISGYAVLPLLCTIPLFWILRPNKKNVLPQRLAWWKTFNPLILLCTLTAINIFAVKLNWSYISQLAKNSGMFGVASRYLRNFLKFDLRTALASYYEYFRSVMGTYVWGHSYYHEFVYALFFLAFLFLALKATNFVYKHNSNLKRRVFVYLLSVLLAAQLVLVLVAMSGRLNADNIYIASFLKVRLTAPGAGAFIGIAALGLYELVQNKKSAERFFAIAWCWVALLMIYYLPKFNWADAF